MNKHAKIFVTISCTTALAMPLGIKAHEQHQLKIEQNEYRQFMLWCSIVPECRDAAKDDQDNYQRQLNEINSTANKEYIARMQEIANNAPVRYAPKTTPEPSTECTPPLICTEYANHPTLL